MLRCSRGLLLQLGQRVAAPSLHFTRPISLLTASFYNGQSSSSFGSMPVSTMFLAVLTAMATGAVSCSEAENQADPGDSDQKLPIFRLEEISHHKTKETGIWVVYEGYVYDISRFVANHPGGREKIMMAAGGDIAPFWNLYRQHKNSVLATEMLHKMKIGRLHEEDAVKLKQQAEDASKGSTDEADPFSKDPTLSPIMKFYQRQPINAEPPGFVLTDSWITPADMWFVRNHHPVVNTPIDDVDHKHEVDICFARDLVDEAGQEKSIKSFTLADLKTKFPRHSVVSTVQCGGNRRAEMTSLERTNGSNWEISAISNAKWTGVRLRDVLAFMGITEESLFGEEGDDRKAPIKHVHFVSNDGMEASIPIKKALSRFGDVLLAYEMNDEPLPPKHGFPLRAIAPGHVGVRNVKWVSKIRLSGEEAYGTWQRGMAYKGFGPSVKSLDNIDVEAIPSLQEQPVQSAITYPTKGTFLSAGDIHTIKGYAYSGGGRGIVRVDVSIDGGKTWQTAKLTEGNEQPLDRAYAWTFWELDVDIPATAANGKLDIICKATDASYNVQPDTVQGIWNLRGINNNAWHQISADIVSPESETDDEEE